MTAKQPQENLYKSKPKAPPPPPPKKNQKDWIFIKAASGTREFQLQIDNIDDLDRDGLINNQGNAFILCGLCYYTDGTVSFKLRPFNGYTLLEQPNED